MLIQKSEPSGNPHHLKAGNRLIEIAELLGKNEFIRGNNNASELIDEVSGILKQHHDHLDDLLFDKSHKPDSGELLFHLLADADDICCEFPRWEKICSSIANLLIDYGSNPIDSILYNDFNIKYPFFSFEIATHLIRLEMKGDVRTSKDGNKILPHLASNCADLFVGFLDYDSEDPKLNISDINEYVLESLHRLHPETGNTLLHDLWKGTYWECSEEGVRSSSVIMMDLSQAMTQWQATKLLLENGVDPTCRNNDGVSGYDMVFYIIHNHPTQITTMDIFDAYEFLIARNEEKNLENQTPSIQKNKLVKGPGRL